MEDIQKRRQRKLKWYHDHKDYCNRVRSRYPGWTKKNHREYSLQRTYGLTTEQYDVILKEQDGACAICRHPFTDTPNVDHSHETGRIRGLLCGSCNRGLGGFRDNLEYMVSAIAYIRNTLS